MKFYRAYHGSDPASSDALFPTRKARDEYVKEMYEPGDDRLVLDEIEMKGPLTKEMVCRIYSLAMR